MIIKGKVKLYCHEDSFSTSVGLSVKFKLPHQIFHRTKGRTIASTFYNNSGYNFESEAIKRLQDRDFLESVAKDVIIEYITKLFKETKKDKNIKEIEKLISEINTGFEVEVEYK